MQLNGAIALVTGASSGIGAATAEYLGHAGARLLLTGRDEQRLDMVAARTGAVALLADLTEPDGPDRLVERALAAEGRIDVLVCNAGIGWPFFARRGRPYHRHWPGPIPAERVAAAVARAVASDLPLVYVPGWLRIPAWLHGAAPRTFAAIAGRFS